MKHIEIDELDISSYKENSLNYLKINLATNALGEPWQIPIMLAKGKKKGPTLGITAVLHGNELNGIPIIQQLMQKLDVSKLSGNIIAIPVLNVPGFMNGMREFIDGKDLNRLMPGKKDGTSSQVFCYEIVTKILKHFDYHIDLHTASFGRVNSLYVRADLSSEIVKKMALLQEPQIIVNIPGGTGTLRKTATDMGIPAITVEAGDPQVFQKRHIRPSIFGAINVLIDLGMLDQKLEDLEGEPIICRSSEWIYADCGGVLEVYPKLADEVKINDRVAVIKNIYGEIIKEIRAPFDGVVVGKSTNPVCQTGSRVIHLGIFWEDEEE